MACAVEVASCRWQSHFAYYAFNKSKSVKKHTDLALRRVSGILGSEAVIMMIAVGLLPEELNVAQSMRKSLKEALIVQSLK